MSNFYCLPGRAGGTLYVRLAVAAAARVDPAAFLAPEALEETPDTVEETGGARRHLGHPGFGRSGGGGRRGRRRGGEERLCGEESGWAWDGSWREGSAVASMVTGAALRRKGVQSQHTRCRGTRRRGGDRGGRSGSLEARGARCVCAPPASGWTRPWRPATAALSRWAGSG